MNLKELSECRILIVDDVKANVDTLVEALRGEYKISVALDGEGALRTADKNPPDLVLLDIVMPGMDGYEVCRRMRASEELREVPIMFLSALEDVRDKAKGFEAGGNDYLTKPFDILEVKVRVKSLLKAKSYADAVKAALERELSIAREIQMGILPSDFSPCTAGTGLDIAAAIEPAREVGGDLFEVLRADEDRVVVAVGDVSGKGIPSALFMAVTVTLLRVLARQMARPDQILARLNDALERNNPRGMFVTLACLVIDLRTHRITSASAGHNALVVVGPGREPRFVLRSTGMVLGLFPDQPYTSETLDLAPGETLVLYSDGVTEAHDPALELFGDERLLQTVAARVGAPAKETVDGLLAAVRLFAAGAPQSDDITVFALRREEPKA